MATTTYLRDTTNNGIGSTYLDMGAVGASEQTCVVNTTASGTEIQFTVTGGGAVRQWVSGRVPAGGFTLAGQMTFSIWARESNMSANCGIRVRIFKRTSAGVETEISSGWAYGSPTEISATALTEYVWNGTPASTAFAEDDRILLKAYIINVGTMGGGYTCTLSYNAAGGSTGDSFLTINETVTFKTDIVALTQGISGADEQLAQSDAQSLGHGLNYVDPTAGSFADAHSEEFLGFYEVSDDDDALSLSDDLALRQAYLQDNVEDTPIALSDAIATFAAWLYPDSDTLSLSDDLETRADWFNDQSDTLELSDDSSASLEEATLDIPETLDDTLTLDELVKVIFTDLFETDDTLTLDEDLALLLGLLSELADEFTLVDGDIGQLFNTLLAASDTLGLSDSIAAQVDWLSDQSDILDITDDISIDFSAGTVLLEVSADDTLGITDGISGILDFFLSDGDIIVFSDQTKGVYNSGLDIHDALWLSEAISLRLGLWEILTDTLDLSDDSLTEFLGPFEASLDDSLSMDESQEFQFHYNPAIRDYILFLDEILEKRDYYPLFSDSLEQSDLCEVAIPLEVSAADNAANLSDASGEGYTDFDSYPWHHTSIVNIFADRSF